MAYEPIIPVKWIVRVAIATVIALALTTSLFLWLWYLHRKENEAKAAENVDALDDTSEIHLGVNELTTTNALWSVANGSPKKKKSALGHSLNLQSQRHSKKKRRPRNGASGKSSAESAYYRQVSSSHDESDSSYSISQEFSGSIDSQDSMQSIEMIKHIRSRKGKQGYESLKTADCQSLDGSSIHSDSTASPQKEWMHVDRHDTLQTHEETEAENDGRDDDDDDEEEEIKLNIA